MVGAAVAHSAAQYLSARQSFRGLVRMALILLGVPVCRKLPAHSARWRHPAGVPVEHTPIGVQPARCAGELNSE
jgi:hypothetical protein